MKTWSADLTRILRTKSNIGNPEIGLRFVITKAKKQDTLNIQNILEPRFRSRPKLSYDQTMQTEMTSDADFTDRSYLRSDLPDQNDLWSDFADQNVLWSDRTQTTVQTIVRLWSDPNSDHCPDYKQTMTRPSSDHGPDSISDHCPDLNQTMIRLKCAQNSLIRERF